MAVKERINHKRSMVYLEIGVPDVQKKILENKTMSETSCQLKTTTVLIAGIF